MKLSVLALDYDGTIAQHDVLDPSVRDAIAAARTHGVLVLLVTGRILDELRRVAGDLHFAVTPLGLLWAAAIALLSTLLAISTFFAGLSIVGPSTASIISTAEPSVTVGLAALVLHESISGEQVLGGILILAAVLTLQWRTPRQQRDA